MRRSDCSAQCKTSWKRCGLMWHVFELGTRSLTICGEQEGVREFKDMLVSRFDTRNSRSFMGTEVLL
jgi:hypothetical protein